MNVVGDIHDHSLRIDMYRMRKITIKIVSKKPNEIVFNVHHESDDMYIGQIKYFPNNKRFKAYGNIKINFNHHRKEYEHKCNELIIESILLED